MPTASRSSQRRATVAEAVEAARAYAPDVLLMDVRMPELDGIRATREVARLAPDVRIVAMTGLAVAGIVGSMVEAGALGFLPKVGLADEMEQKRIRIAAAGESFRRPARRGHPDDRGSRQRRG